MSRSATSRNRYSTLLSYFIALQITPFGVESAQSKMGLRNSGESRKTWQVPSRVGEAESISGLVWFTMAAETVRCKWILFLDS
jgi:hypothetical protein